MRSYSCQNLQIHLIKVTLETKLMLIIKYIFYPDGPDFSMLCSSLIIFEMWSFKRNVLKLMWVSNNHIEHFLVNMSSKFSYKKGHLEFTIKRMTLKHIPAKARGKLNKLNKKAKVR